MCVIMPQVGGRGLASAQGEAAAQKPPGASSENGRVANPTCRSVDKDPVSTAETRGCGSGMALAEERPDALNEQKDRLA